MLKSRFQGGLCHNNIISEKKLVDSVTVSLPGLSWSRLTATGVGIFSGRLGESFNSILEGERWNLKTCLFQGTCIQIRTCVWISWWTQTTPNCSYKWLKKMATNGCVKLLQSALILWWPLTVSRRDLFVRPARLSHLVNCFSGWGSSLLTTKG